MYPYDIPSSQFIQQALRMQPDQVAQFNQATRGGHGQLAQAMSPQSQALPQFTPGQGTQGQYTAGQPYFGPMHQALAQMLASQMPQAPSVAGYLSQGQQAPPAQPSPYHIDWNPQAAQQAAQAAQMMQQQGGYGWQQNYPSWLDGGSASGATGNGGAGGVGSGAAGVAGTGPGAGAASGVGGDDGGTY